MRPPRPKLRLEALEARDVPAITAALNAGVLTVSGTAGDDAITLREANNRLLIAGVSQDFATAALSKVELDAGDGNDRVDVRSVTVPVDLHGLTGADRVVYDQGHPVRFADWGPMTTAIPVNPASDPLYSGPYRIARRVSAGGGFVTLFSNGSAYFSPDGYHPGGGGNTQLVFQGGGSTSIIKMVAAGGGVVTLFNTGVAYFSPDGQHLAGGGNTVRAYTGTQDITDIVPVAGGVLTVFHDSTINLGSNSAYFSPTGRNIGGGTGTVVAYTAPSDGLRILHVVPVHNGVVTLFADGKVSYSPDGRNLRTTAGLTAAYTGTQDAKTIEPVAGGVVTLFEEGGVYFSPDGKNIGSRQVYAGTQTLKQLLPFRNGILALFSQGGVYLSTTGTNLGSGAPLMTGMNSIGGYNSYGSPTPYADDYDVVGYRFDDSRVTVPASSISSTIPRTPLPNGAPTVRRPDDVTIAAGATLTIPLGVYDPQGPIGLTVTATSTSPVLTGTALQVVHPAMSEWSLKLTPGAAGTASITMTVSDGTFSASTTFTVTVPPPPPPPAQRGTAFGAFPGAGPVISLVGADGSRLRDIPVYDASFRGGVRVAVGDLNGDGVADAVAGPGPGMPTLLRAFDGATGAVLWERLAFEAGFTAGVFLAVGELTGDGQLDVVVTPDRGGGPVVKLLRGDTGADQAAFFGIEDANFRGGARPTVGDINGDGRLDLIVGAGISGGPRVAIFDGRTLLAGGTPPRVRGDFFAFEQSVRDGVYLAAGDLDGDGFEELVVGGGPGGAPRVLALSGRRLTAGRSVDEAAVANFFAFDASARAGVLVACGDANGDGRTDILATPGTGGTTQAFDGRTLAPLNLAGATPGPAAITRPFPESVPAPDPTIEPSALDPDYFRYRTFEGTFDGTRTETWGLLGEPDQTETRALSGTFRITLKFNGEGVPTGLNVADGWSVVAATATVRQDRSFPAAVDTPNLTGDAYQLRGVRYSTDYPILLTGGFASLDMLDESGGVRRLIILRFTFNTDDVTGDAQPWNDFTRSEYSVSLRGRFQSYGRPAGVYVG